MRNEDVINLLEEKDLPEHFRIVAETCGIETAKKLILEMGGLSVYIPKLSSIRSLVEKYVNLNKDSYSIKKIARDLDLNERTLMKIYGRKM